MSSSSGGKRFVRSQYNPHKEARRLMLNEELDAKVAAFRVGYQDASHFNREYKSLFGISPMRDVHRLREESNLVRS